MATVNLGNRFYQKYSRIKLHNVQLSGKVSEFRHNVASVIDAPPAELELIYCGRCLQDEETVDSYGIMAGVTVHVMKKKDRAKIEPEPLDKPAIQQMITALQAALLNPATNRNIAAINRMLTSPETLENIVAATPGLEDDPVAFTILQTPQFFVYLADPDTVEKILEAHPSLGPAAMMVAAALNEEAAKVGAGAREESQAESGTYSLDQMSDDEDFGNQIPPGHREAVAGNITSTQLAAALAAATRTTSSSPQGSSRSPRGGSQGPSASGITGDFFRQAMMQAMQTSGSPRSGDPSPGSSSSTEANPLQRHQLQSQIEQLRDMGITDEAAALQALQATGGDVQLALAILFGDH